MTGYGKASGNAGNKVFTVEVRSLNSRQLDATVKLPFRYKDKELEVRNLVSSKLERGKIDVFINYESDTEKSYSINKAAVTAYYNDLQEVYHSLGKEMNDNILGSIIRLPDALQSEKEENDEEEWKQVQKIIEQAIHACIDFRTTEGATLENELTSRIDIIGGLLLEVDGYEKERIETVKERIQRSLNEMQLKENFDQNRFEQELIYYMEKLDVTEEKLRLKTHCEYFIETMQNEKSQGRKLGFITQEIGREINTLGSKCNHAAIQKLVVQMKDELEKIKEQSLNVL